jgi:hypothetical protein
MSWPKPIVTLLRADAAWEIPEAAESASYGLYARASNPARICLGLDTEAGESPISFSTTPATEFGRTANQAAAVCLWESGLTDENPESSPIPKGEKKPGARRSIEKESTRSQIARHLRRTAGS